MDNIALVYLESHWCELVDASCRVNVVLGLMGAFPPDVVDLIACKASPNRRVSHYDRFAKRMVYDQRRLA